MPTFTKRVRFSNLAGTVSVETDAMVDTGSTFCQIPQEMAERLQLVPTSSRRLRFADGRVAEYPLADARVELVDLGEAVAIPVIIGDRGAAPLFGALALDAFSLGIDTEGRRLIPKVADLLSETQWPTV